MIKKLRWKFIAVAMISIIVVLMAIIGTITLINYNKTVDNIDKVLTVLVDNNGKFDDLDFGDDYLENTILLKMKTIIKTAIIPTKDIQVPVNTKYLIERISLVQSTNTTNLKSSAIFTLHLYAP